MVVLPSTCLGMSWPKSAIADNWPDFEVLPGRAEILRGCGLSVHPCLESGVKNCNAIPRVAMQPTHVTGLDESAVPMAHVLVIQAGGGSQGL